MKYVAFLAIFLGILAFLVLLILLLMKPNKRRTNMETFKNTFIAHRGFFDNDKVPENSYPAFEAAVKRGFGIELDVQLTTDNQLVIFHDDSLKRMCGSKKKVTSLSYSELSEFKLLSTDLSAPLFKDVLDMVNGRVPLIIEIKAHGPFIKTSKELAKVMDSYTGPYCIESFNPAVIAWFKKNRPDTIRGILASDYLRIKNKTMTQKLIVSNLLFNAYCKPDFIAYNFEYQKKWALNICKKLFNCNMVAWTIRSSDQLKAAKDFFEVFIFDSFDPKN